MAFVSEEVAQIFMRGNFGIFALIKAKGPKGYIRAWFGDGDHDMSANLIDTTGGTYLGLGQLLDLPSLQQLVNGIADRIEINVSGVDSRIIALADEDAETVRSVPVHVGLVGFDRTHQPATGVVWKWEGTADVPRVAKTSTAGEGGAFEITRTMSLSIVSIMSGRKRPPQSYYTGIEQRRRSPTDAFLDRVNIYNAGTTDKWP